MHAMDDTLSRRESFIVKPVVNDVAGSECLQPYLELPPVRPRVEANCVSPKPFSILEQNIDIDGIA